MSLSFLTRTVPANPSAPLPDFNTMQARAKESLDAEIRRIVDLPICQPLSPEDVDIVSRHYLSDVAYAEGERLRPEQALAMVHYNDYGGIFVTLGVGGGKTLISFAVANDCYKKIIQARQNGDMSKDARILLVVQANLLEKFENDAPFMRWFLRDIPPYFILKGNNKRHRTLLSKSGRRGLYVCSYHTLSSKDATDILEAINPACIICDEAQNVAGTKDSARAKRFRNFVNAQQPEIVPLSGTMTRKSVMEYFYLAKTALGANNFMPNSHQMAEEWAGVLDSAISNIGDFRNDIRPRPGPISIINEWCNKHFTDVEVPPNLTGFRRAYAKRMVTAPGVITSTTPDLVGAGLIYSNNACKDKESRPGWDQLLHHVKILIEDSQTPSGEELACAMNVWGYRYQMEATGFYYDLYWREAGELSKARKISFSAAQDILERSKEAWEYHKQYTAALRWWLSNNSKPRLDTPALVGSNMSHHGDKYVGAKLYTAWQEWKAAIFPEMDCRQSRPVRVCDFKIHALADDVEANRKEGGIVWYHHAEMGVWMMEELKNRGLNPVHCPRGPDANKYLSDTRKMKGDIIVASMIAHSTGKDLQHGFHRNYYLQSPISATTAEQSIGRTHRPGQNANDVEVMYYLGTDFDVAHFNALLTDTAYVQQSTEGKQKLLIGSYNFRPKSIPYTALAEMGARIPRLDRDKERLLEGIFNTKICPE
jgi:hypothetical protein